MAIEVYCHTSPSGRRYVGYSAKGMSARWRAHVGSASRGSKYPFHCAIRKYGPDAFTHELIASCDTEDQARALEVQWIAGLDSMLPAGYNATAGGEGMRPSPAVRAKMSRALLGNTRGSGRRGQKQRPATSEERARHLASVQGRTLSEQHKARIGDASRGRRHTPEANEKNRLAHLGKKASPETRAKLSAAMVARHAARRAAAAQESAG